MDRIGFGGTIVYSGVARPTRALLLVVALVASLLVALPPGQPTVHAAEPLPELVSFTPFRAADTRTGAGVVPPRGVLEVPVAGRLGVPGDAAAVVLNVAAVTPTAGGHLTVWPCGQARPTASTLNYPAGRTVANMALAVPGTGGKVCVYTHAATHLIVDVSGYWPAGSAYTGRVPVRAADTRDGTGVPAGVVPARSVLTVPVAGLYGVPAEAAAVAVNVAAVTPTAGGHLTVWPCGTARPTASNVNYVAGETTADAVLVKPGAGGAVCVYTHAATHVILDVAGHLAAGSAFTGMVPARAADTRNGVPAWQVAAGGTLEVPIAGKFGVPAGAGAVSVTVTAVTPTAGGHLTVYPCGDPRPTASNVNYVAGRTMAAATIARLGDGGSLCVYSHAPAHLLVDVNGHYATGELGSGTWAVDDNCALTPGGYVKCWDSEGTRVVPGIVGATAISGKCAIVGGQVKCWYNDGKFWTAPGVSGATALETGPSHSCAVVTGGSVMCWGSNDDGQLGRTGSSTDPAVVPGVTNAVSVAVGGEEDYPNDGRMIGRTCAVLANADVLCWGWGNPTPTRVPGIKVKDVAIDFDTTCFVLTTGTVQCTNSSGPVLQGVASIAANSGYPRWFDSDQFCAVMDDGTARCWGGNTFGQLGDGTTLDSGTPVTVVGLRNVVSVSPGQQSCALLADGDVTCWGARIPGLSSKPSPHVVGSLPGVEQLAADGDHSCALASGRVWCWGSNNAHEVGAGATFVPTAVPTVSGAVALDASDSSSCAVTDDARAWCWGNYVDFEYTPSGVEWGGPTLLPYSGVRHVAAENNRSGVCVLQTGGKVTCNDGFFDRTEIASGATAFDVGFDSCAIVDGGVTCSQTGSPFPPGSGVSAIAVGGYGCAVIDTTVECWGSSNGSGQLGDGTTSSRQTPVPVTGLGAVRDVTVGGGHACALVADGTVWCWGNNDHGQLGDGTTTARATPAKVPGVSGVTAIAAGRGHTCAAGTDGTLWCWGNNSNGAAGANPGWVPEWRVPGL